MRALRRRHGHALSRIGMGRVERAVLHGMMPTSAAMAAAAGATLLAGASVPVVAAAGLGAATGGLLGAAVTGMTVHLDEERKRG